MTRAHRSLPFGTHVRVANLSNNHSAVLVVDDRGPFIKGRIIDVSVSAADVLGFRHAGLAQVMVETVMIRAFSSKTDTASRQENAIEQRSRAPLIPRNLKAL
jgi:rare lipoprotein A